MLLMGVSSAYKDASLHTVTQMCARYYELRFNVLYGMNVGLFKDTDT